MWNNTRIFTIAAMVFSVASCRPKEPVQPVEVIPETEMAPVILPMIDAVYGAMYSIKIHKVVNGVESRAEMASAVFYNEPSNTATATEGTPAGQVTINNFNLNQNTENGGYIRTAIEGQIFSNLNFEDGVTWEVGGEDGIPPMTFTWSQFFPAYNGYIPASIERSQSLKFTFDESTLVYTDSVFVAISAGTKTIVKRYSANAGQVTIPSEELRQLQRCTADRPGYLQISATMVDIFNIINGNPAALVKQQTEIRSIVIQ